jgi:hypothetical protein
LRIKKVCLIILDGFVKSKVSPPLLWEGMKGRGISNLVKFLVSSPSPSPIKGEGEGKAVSQQSL